MARTWLRGQLDRTPAERAAEVAEDEAHQCALKHLLTSRQDQLQPTYLDPENVPRPARPLDPENVPRPARPLDPDDVSQLACPLDPDDVPRLARPAVHNAPRRPQVILHEVARGQRFEMIYRHGKPVDRIDHQAEPGGTKPLHLV